jgi:phosphate/sulfate permease
MADNIFDNPASLLTYYQTQAEEFRFRFQAIWDAMRHYTWLLSILLAGWPLALLLNKDVTIIRASLHYLIISPILGLCFSVIAYFVVRKAYDFYNETEARLFYIEKVLGVTSQKDFLDSRREKALGEDFSVKKYIENSQHLGTFIPWNAKIRTLFLSGFIVFALVAILEIVFCLTY